MDCKNARLLLDFARPFSAELEAGEVEALESHLADCPDCGVLAQHERRLDDHLGQAVRNVPMPPDLRSRLLGRLAVERDAWYRRWVLRGAGFVAAAAVIVLLVWGGLTWTKGRLSALDPSDFQVNAIDSPKDVEGWFKETYGIKTVAPSDTLMKYTWLAHYDLEEFQGRRVPMLLFIYNGHDAQARAQVYIVTDEQFKDLHDLVNQPRKVSRGYTFELIPNQDAPGVYYVVLYTDGSRDRFFKKKPIAT